MHSLIKSSNLSFPREGNEWVGRQATDEGMDGGMKGSMKARMEELNRRNGSSYRVEVPLSLPFTFFRHPFFSDFRYPSIHPSVGASGSAGEGREGRGDKVRNSARDQISG